MSKGVYSSLGMVFIHLTLMLAFYLAAEWKVVAVNGIQLRFSMTKFLLQGENHFKSIYVMDRKREERDPVKNIIG